MKKYRFCLLLFLIVSLVCIAVGYGARKYSERQKESQENEIMSSETAVENHLAESSSEEESEAEPANQESINKYYLVCEDNFLLVFCKDKSTVCLYTHVPITDFPEDEQARLRAGIWFSSMMDIFSYLESYTS
ncbi:hypothetical protein [Clostridium sp. AM58-1XD]|uniref:hypothetical protein n=1 Tax=Clostridium sp. AM58-1XD TaxID=2292307 RepID=UPI000E4EE621|nr:hypothetical protein [Clostridium sp. AM58-1XD]RGZ01624.1 hypothetical protein DXA13_01175 [Clostridium sp. AM58-1XD]